jgi:hypothetical protein
LNTFLGDWTELEEPSGLRGERRGAGKEGVTERRGRMEKRA